MRKELEKLIYQQLANIQKVAILGLKKAGKTTITKTVLYRFDDLVSLAPGANTQPKNFEFLGRELIVRDIGGTARYEKNFFKNPPPYVSQIRFVYFIIDVQAEELVRQNIAYFHKCLEFCKKKCPYAKIYLFFHKFDVKNLDPAEFQQNEIRFLQNTLPALQMYQNQVSIFHTTVQNESTIFSAFLQPLLGNQDLYETLCNTIQQFCIDNSFNFGALFIDDFEIGHYYTDISALKAIYGRIFDIYKTLKRKPSESQAFDKLLDQAWIHTEKLELMVDRTTFTFFFSVGLHVNEEKFRQIKVTRDFLLHLGNILEHAEIIREGSLDLERIEKS